MKVMYGTAFRAPTFAEVYNVNNPVLNGNLAIKPEKVRTLELGFEAKFTDELSSGVTFFHNNIRDIIAPSAGLYQNTSVVKTQGVELSGKFKFSRGRYLEGNYSYVNAKNNTSGVYLPDIASSRGNIMFNWQFSDQFNMYADAFMQSSTSRVATDTRGRLGGYTLMNMTLIAKQLSSSLSGMELRASIYNLLNRKYASPSPVNSIPQDYTMPKLNFMIEARYKL
jgi:iron complex outermembrane receptor protein